MSKKARSGSKFLEFSKEAQKIKVPKVISFQKERIAACIPEKLCKTFKPQLSRKGIQVREQARLTKELKQLEKRYQNLKYLIS